jgi:hypothetical protein
VVKQFGVKKPKKLLTINGIGWRFIDKQKYIEVQGFSIKNNEMCTFVHTIVFANLYVSLLQVQSICHAKFFKFNTNNINSPTPKFYMEKQNVINLTKSSTKLMNNSLIH